MILHVFCYKVYGVGNEDKGLFMYISCRAFACKRAIPLRDPLKHSTAALEGDRLALAAISRNEKVSGRTVGEGLVLVAHPSGRVLLPSGDYLHPPRRHVERPGY